jgi:hypothetical protein
MKLCSIFSQVLKLFSRGEFERAVKEHKAGRHARGFASWGQFMAMMFRQLARAGSLREICGGPACCEGQLKHLGVPVAPKTSTLAYANEPRPWQLYQTVFEQTLFKCQELAQSRGGRKRFRFHDGRRISLLRIVPGRWLASEGFRLFRHPPGLPTNSTRRTDRLSAAARLQSDRLGPASPLRPPSRSRNRSRPLLLED